jgi:hypothetical protein
VHQKVLQCVGVSHCCCQSVVTAGMRGVGSALVLALAGTTSHHVSKVKKKDPDDIPQSYLTAQS